MITQLWVKTDKEQLAKIRETGLHVHGLSLPAQDEILANFEQQIDLQNKLRQMEPFDLSPPAGDIHSHVICVENVVIILGHLTQLAMSGLRTPYILYASYDENLLCSDHLDHLISSYRMDEILWKGYAYLVSLITMQIAS